MESVSIYSGKEVVLAPMNTTCTLCSEVAYEIFDGMPLCGIPGNHAAYEVENNTADENNIAA